MARGSVGVVTQLLLMETDWVPVLDLGGARFWKHSTLPECYRRKRSRDDGSVETRYACDDTIVATIGDLADRYVHADDGR